MRILINTKQLAKSFTMCLLIFLFFRPESYVIGQRLYNYTSYLIVFFSFFSIVYLLIGTRTGLYTLKKPIRWFWLLYFWCLGGSTALNRLLDREESIINAIIFLGTMTLYIVCAEIAVSKNPKQFLFCYMLVGGIMCSLNVYTIFKYGYSGGMNSLTQYFGTNLTQNYFLLGEDNSTYYMAWPTLVITWIYYFKYNQTKSMGLWAIFYTIINIISYVYMWSIVAAIACISVPVTLILFLRKINDEKKSRRHGFRIEEKKILLCFFDFYWIVGLVFNCLIGHNVITDFVGQFSAKYLNKTITLSNRTAIWKRSLEYVRKSILFGYGNEPNQVTMNKIILNHTHNLYLETLYRGGIIGLVILVIAFVILARRVSKAKQTGIYMWLQLMLFFFLLFASMDFAFYRYHFLILIVLLEHSEIFEDIGIKRRNDNSKQCQSS